MFVRAAMASSETLLPATTQVTWVQVHVTHIRHGFTYTRSKLTLCLLQVNCHNKVNARMKVEVVQVYITHIRFGSTYTRSKLTQFLMLAVNCRRKVNARLKVDVCGRKFTPPDRRLTHSERRLHTADKVYRRQFQS